MRERFGMEHLEEPKPSSKPEMHGDDSLAGGSAPDVETAKEALDAYLETFLETHAERTNEGNNGIILRLDVRDIAPNLRAAFAAAGMDLGTEQVAKVLKVYSKGRGRLEFDLQKEAHTIADAQDNAAPHALVPAPRYYADIPLSRELKEKLKRTSSGFSASDRIEILLMDEVRGADIATVLYREVIRRHPKSAHLAESADALDIETLREEVTRVLDFKIPGGKARSDAERAWEEEKVNNENMGALVTWLGKKGFQIAPHIMEAISNTMNAFHENGLAFRDAHPRNFMVDGSIEAGHADATNTYIIDFGNAKRFAGRFIDEKGGLYVDEINGRRYPTDDLTTNMLKPLTLSPEERASATETGYLSELTALKKRMDGTKNAKLISFMERLPVIIAAGSENQARAHADIATSPAAANVDYLLAPLKEFIAHGDITKEHATAFLVHLQAKLKTEDRNKVSRFLKHLQ